MARKQQKTGDAAPEPQGGGAPETDAKPEFHAPEDFDLVALRRRSLSSTNGQPEASEDVSLEQRLAEEFGYEEEERGDGFVRYARTDEDGRKDCIVFEESDNRSPEDTVSAWRSHLLKAGKALWEISGVLMRMGWTADQFRNPPF